jgi:oligopeptidase B
VATTHFGDTRIDEYSWLRDRDDPAVTAYLESENEFAAAALTQIAALEQQVYDELISRIEETDVSCPVRWGPYWYYERTFTGKSYPVHCRRPAGREEVPRDLDDGAEQVILDENELAAGHEFCSVGVLDVSPDHELAAIGVDFEGDERHTVSFHSLGGRNAPAETLEDVSYSVAWTTDAGSLLYVRADAAWRPHELWRHVLGTDPGDDVLVYREDDERYRVSVSRSRDGAALVVHVASAMTTEVLFADPLDPTALTMLWARREGVECSMEHLVAPDGSPWWVAATNDGARDFKVVASRADGPASFREIVGERPDARIEGVEAFRGHLVLTGRTAGDASVRILPLAAGGDPFGPDLDARGYDVGADEQPATTALGANPEFDTSAVRVVQTSFVTPLSDLDVELGTGGRTLRKRRPVGGGYDASQYVSARLHVRARDGTEVPVSIVHHRDLLTPGGAPGDTPRVPAPTLLYGYGAYDMSMDPVFSPSRLSLLDRGVLYAIAHVRGGGELGRRWYEAGRLEHKANSFSDFVDVARGLVALGYSEPSGAVAMGGSAGGLLVGAAINEAPDAFCAVIAEVPFVDALNTILDPTLPLTVSEWEEWGDPLHDEAAYERMKSWSPYDNVTGVNPDGSPRIYPELLVLGSLNDTRVSYWEPAKWVARLRASNPQNRVILRTDLGAGHAGPSGRYDAWRERAMVYAFALDRLGATDAPRPPASPPAPRADAEGG